MRSPRRFRSRKSSIARDFTIATTLAPLTVRAEVLPPIRRPFLTLPAARDSVGFPLAAATRNRAMGCADAAVEFLVHPKRARHDREDRDRSCASDCARVPEAGRVLFRFAGAR